MSEEKKEEPIEKLERKIDSLEGKFDNFLTNHFSHLVENVSTLTTDVDTLVQQNKTQHDEIQRSIEIMGTDIRTNQNVLTARMQELWSMPKLKEVM